MNTQTTQKLTPQDILNRKKQGEKITCLTAYDYPFAKLLDESGVDILLVGDSLGMVLLGYETTTEVTLEDMIHHGRPVARAAKRSLVVIDMPFASYENPEQAARNAKELVEKTGADAVKLEGGQKVEAQVKAILSAGIPVMGHVGMTPQSIDELGGYRVQGRNPEQADQILKDAMTLDTLGVFAIVLECIPQVLAKTVTEKVNRPTIGIGAGPATDGQVLVLHDMLGFSGKVEPKFVRRYAEIEKSAREAIAAYCADVLKGNYPAQGESY